MPLPPPTPFSCFPLDIWILIFNVFLAIASELTGPYTTLLPAPDSTTTKTRIVPTIKNVLLLSKVLRTTLAPLFFESAMLTIVNRNYPPRFFRMLPSVWLTNLKHLRIVFPDNVDRGFGTIVKPAVDLATFLAGLNQLELMSRLNSFTLVDRFRFLSNHFPPRVIRLKDAPKRGTQAYQDWLAVRFTSGSAAYLLHWTLVVRQHFEQRTFTPASFEPQVYLKASLRSRKQLYRYRATELRFFKDVQQLRSPSVSYTMSRPPRNWDLAVPSLDPLADNTAMLRLAQPSKEGENKEGEEGRKGEESEKIAKVDEAKQVEEV